jgi:hypothetical protein
MHVGPVLAVWLRSLCDVTKRFEEMRALKQKLAEVTKPAVDGVAS